MFMSDQELLSDKQYGRIYYQIQFFTGGPESGIWLYAQGNDGTRDLTMGEMEKWVALLDSGDTPYRLYQFQEITHRRFVGGCEPYGN